MIGSLWAQSSQKSFWFLFLFTGKLHDIRLDSNLKSKNSNISYFYLVHSDLPVVGIHPRKHRSVLPMRRTYRPYSRRSR